VPGPGQMPSSVAQAASPFRTATARAAEWGDPGPHGCDRRSRPRRELAGQGPGAQSTGPANRGRPTPPTSRQPGPGDGGGRGTGQCVRHGDVTAKLSGRRRYRLYAPAGRFEGQVLDTGTGGVVRAGRDPYLNGERPHLQFPSGPLSARQFSFHAELARAGARVGAASPTVVGAAPLNLGFEPFAGRAVLESTKL
jgi:hypothetical protein